MTPDLDNPLMDKKRLFIWSLYDLAHTIVMIVFFLYYSQWLVVDCGVSDFWYNFTYVISSLLLLLTAPVAASIADKRKLKMPGLRWVTVLAFVFFLITGGIAVYAPRFYLLSAVTFSVASYFYLFSYVFYNSLLEDVAGPAHQCIASGWGQFGHLLGEVVGILFALPFVNGKTALLGGASGRTQAFIPATILFFILALPMLLLKEKSTRVEVKINISEEFKNAWGEFWEMCRAPGLGVFLLSYFFFNDAVITFLTTTPSICRKSTV